MNALPFPLHLAMFSFSSLLSGSQVNHCSKIKLLLDEYERSDVEWVKNVRVKIDDEIANFQRSLEINPNNSNAQNNLRET